MGNVKKGGDTMAKKGEARARITLKCTECGEENFRTEKDKKNTEALKMKKNYLKRRVIIHPR